MNYDQHLPGPFWSTIILLAMIIFAGAVTTISRFLMSQLKSTSPHFTSQLSKHPQNKFTTSLHPTISSIRSQLPGAYPPMVLEQEHGEACREIWQLKKNLSYSNKEIEAVKTDNSLLSRMLQQREAEATILEKELRENKRSREIAWITYGDLKTQVQTRNINLAPSTPKSTKPPTTRARVIPKEPNSHHEETLNIEQPILDNFSFPKTRDEAVPKSAKQQLKQSLTENKTVLDRVTIKINKGNTPNADYHIQQTEAHLWKEQKLRRRVQEQNVILKRLISQEKCRQRDMQQTFLNSNMNSDQERLRQLLKRSEVALGAAQAASLNEFQLRKDAENARQLLEDDLKAEQQRTAEEKNQHLKTKESHKKIDSEKESLSRQLEEMSQAKIAWSVKLRDTETEIARLNDNKAKQDEKVQAHIESLQQQLRGVEEKKSTAITNVKKEDTIPVKDNPETEKEIDTIREELARKEKALERLRGRLRGQENRDKELEDVKNMLAKTQEGFYYWGNMYNQAHLAHKATLAELETAKGDKGAIASLQTELEHLRQENSSQKEQLQKAVNPQTPQRELNQLRAALSEASKEKLLLRQELTERRGQIDKGNRVYNELLQTNRQNATRVQGLEKQLAELQLAASPNDAVIRGLQAKLTQAEAEVNKLQAQPHRDSAMERSFQELNTAKEQAEAEWEKMKTERDESTRFAEQLASQIQNLQQSSPAAVYERLKRAEEHAKAEKSKFQQELAQQKARMDAAELANARKEGEVRDAQKATQQIQIELLDLQTRLSRRASQVDSIRELKDEISRKDQELYNRDLKIQEKDQDVQEAKQGLQRATDAIEYLRMKEAAAQVHQRQHQPEISEDKTIQSPRKRRGDSPMDHSIQINDAAEDVHSGYSATTQEPKGVLDEPAHAVESTADHQQTKRTRDENEFDDLFDGPLPPAMEEFMRQEASHNNDQSNTDLPEN